MSEDALSWIAEAAGYPLLRAAATGPTQANAPAAETLNGRSGTLPEMGSLIAGVPAAQVEELVERARAAGRARGPLGPFGGFALYDGAETLLLLVPNATDTPAEGFPSQPSDLAGRISHELANTLGAILGWSELARRQTKLDARTDRALALIESSARNARESATHMLEIAKGSRFVSPEVVDVSDLLDEIAETLQPLATATGVHVQASVARGLSVETHRTQLHTVFWNLVQNAVEATPRGARVRLRAAADAGWVRVEVDDDGPGIAAADAERVFEPYFTTKTSGTGLGLALVRHTVDSLGGRISVAHGKSGRGACFLVELRAAAIVPVESPGPVRAMSGVLRRADPKGARVLVVDDDVAVSDLVATALAIDGAIVVTAHSAAEALAAEGTFDLALVDLGLEDMRGDALLAELRRRGTTRAAALVSGQTAVPDLDPEARPDVWLRKPFDLDDLYATVCHVLADVAGKGEASGT